MTRHLLVGLLLLLAAPVDAAQVTVQLPDATLRSLIAYVCTHSWAVHHWAPSFSCTDPDPHVVLPTIAAEMGATVEVRDGTAAR